MESKKYSLWIVPKGDAGQKLQALIATLSKEHDAPDFVPHMTAVANIVVEDDNLDAVREKCRELASRIKPFEVTLTSYGYKEEDFRCLYLLAEAPELAGMYQIATEMFPQVVSEHFAALPHISVLYGNYDEATKKDIIAANAITPLTFTVMSFGLYLTNNPVEAWKLETGFVLAG
jgi:2'-5' RNA ligase